MFPHRPLPWLMCALLVVVANSEPAFASQGLKAFAGPSFVVKIEGRKGTRIYRPDVPGDDDASTEPQEKAADRPDVPGDDDASTEPQEKAADPKQTAKAKLDECMASWDKGTHISQSGWRIICQRQIKDSE
jgi:hypothetical protein